MEPTIVCKFCGQQLEHLKDCPTIPREIQNSNPNEELTWKFLFDCFVYLFHGSITRHRVSLDINYSPPKPVCDKNH